MNPRLRDPADPEAPVVPSPPEDDRGPTTPAPRSDPAPGPPPVSSRPEGLQPGTRRAPRGTDDTTWETWWELHRSEFLPLRPVRQVVSPAGAAPPPRVPGPMDAELVRTRVWRVLTAAVGDRDDRVREAGLVALARVAADDAQRAEARTILLEALRGRDHLHARAAALGLYHVPGPATPMHLWERARDPGVDHDVRAFAALTLTQLGHDVGQTLLQTLIGEAHANNLVAGPALMALGHARSLRLDDAATKLAEVAFAKDRSVPSAHRALALESLAHILPRDRAQEVLLRALRTTDRDVRRSAVIGLGVLDHRTPSQRHLEALPAATAPGGASAPLEARRAALQAQVKIERHAMRSAMRPLLRRLGDVLARDKDAFASRMAAIALGRIHAQDPSSATARPLVQALRQDRRGLREFVLLGMAIGGLPVTLDEARRLLADGDPSTRGAACVALGILATPERADPPTAEVRAACAKALQERLEKDVHPFIRGYAALAAGLVGADAARAGILELVRTTRTSEARAYGLLGLALLGGTEAHQALEATLASPGDMRDPVVAPHAIYALGLTKDRRLLDALLRTASEQRHAYARAAALVGIAYLGTAEAIPDRHRLIRGHNYTLRMPDVLTWFLKL